MPSQSNIKSFRPIAKLHKALSNERRHLLLTFLAGQENPERWAVSDLAERFKISFQLTSRHLQILDNVNMIERVRHGQSVGYIVTPLGKKWASLTMRNGWISSRSG